MTGVLNLLLAIVVCAGIIWFGRGMPLPLTLVAIVVFGELALIQAVIQGKEGVAVWAVLLAAAIAACWVVMAAHRQAGRRFARNHGLRFRVRDDEVINAWDLSIFEEGDRCHARNVITGKWNGRRLTICDFTQITEGRGASARRFAVVALASDCRGRHLEVLPEWSGSRAVGVALGNDIEFESEDFNRAFTVHCDDRRFASNVITPAMMELLLGFPRRDRRLDDRDLLVISRRTAVDYRELPAILAELESLLAAVPEHAC